VVVVSGAVVFALICAGVVLVFMVVTVLLLSRDSPVLRRTRATRWAKEVDLALPDGLVDPLARRLRWRGRAGSLLAVPFAVPAIGFVCWELARGFGPDVPSPDAPLHGPWIGLFLLSATTVPTALADAWDLARLRREESLSGLRELHIGLREAVPAWAVWVARVLTVLPPVLAAALLRDARDKGYAQGEAGLYVVFGFVLVLGLMGLYQVESHQLAVLNGRQSDGTPQARAFDDAFRVRAVLDLVPLLPALAYTVVSAMLEPVFTEMAAHSRVRALDVWEAWGLLGLLAFLFVIVLPMPRVRRYYREGRRRAPATQPPTTETTLC
jgi:hypothetical protein